MGNDGLDSHWHPLRAFTKALLDDLEALQILLRSGRFEHGRCRIGAEQELFLVDRRMQPAMASLQVLEKLDTEQVVTELGLFNLEINLSPLDFDGDCLSRMEREAEDLLAEVSRAARTLGIRVLLTGILPTLRKRDLTLDAMTPNPRYRELNRATVEARGGSFRMNIKGLDDLSVTHDNVMFEACNTSFQIHLQVDADQFAPLYNMAQAITAPCIAAATNSPVFLQHRLWHETRLALFQQSVDSRSDFHQARKTPPRVVFGDRWIRESVHEIFRDDIARFRVFIARDTGPSSLELMREGQVPPLKALCMHNGTVYRWNRPCYGLKDGVPHLRIEHRALPAGPTVMDQVSNAAFFYGLMMALPKEYGEIANNLAFDDAKMNVTAAARYGLEAQLRWADGRKHTASDLILNHLLPLAREGLQDKELRNSDIDRYLGTIEERVRSGRTGSQWLLDSLGHMGDRGRPEERYRTVTSAMYERFLEGAPVHRWPLAELEDDWDWLDGYKTVDQMMVTDMFTVRQGDLVDLAANLMDWERIRHVPVEDRDGKLVGLVTNRQLLRLVSRPRSEGPAAVEEIMVRNPITIQPDTTTVEAIQSMRRNKVSCLPVVDNDGKLMGMVSERDFVHLTAKLLDQMLKHAEKD